MIKLLLTFCLAVTNARATADTKPLEISRRAFTCMVGLAGFGALGVAAQVHADARGVPKAAQQPDVRRMKFGDRVRELLPVYAALVPGIATNLFVAKAMDAYAEYLRAVDEPTSEDARATYLDSVTKAQVLLIAKVTMMTLSTVPLGNINWTNEKMEERRLHPLATGFMATLFAPVVEELMFRLGPALVNKGWGVGTAASVAFAAVHNLNGRGLDLSMIPATQFIGGMYYWYLMRERGIDHAIVAHASNNNALAVAMYLGLRFP